MFNLTSLSSAAARDWNLQFHLIRLMENITIETRQNHIIHLNKFIVHYLAATYL